jgi:hypothetical protein
MPRVKLVEEPETRTSIRPIRLAGKEEDIVEDRAPVAVEITATAEVLRDFLKKR